MSSRLFKQVVVLLALVGIILILAVNAAAPVEEVKQAGHRISAATCKQMTRGVTKFTQRYLRGRKNQVVHCQAGYVAFEAHRREAYVVCTALIREYRKGQYMAMGTKDCIALRYDQVPKSKTPTPPPNLSAQPAAYHPPRPVSAGLCVRRAGGWLELCAFGSAKPLFPTPIAA